LLPSVVNVMCGFASAAPSQDPELFWYFFQGVAYRS